MPPMIELIERTLGIVSQLGQPLLLSLNVAQIVVDTFSIASIILDPLGEIIETFAELRVVFGND